MKLSLLHHAFESAKRTRIGGIGRQERAAAKALDKWRHSPVSCTPRGFPYRDMKEAQLQSPRQKDWKIVTYSDPVSLMNQGLQADITLDQTTALAAARKVLLHFEIFMPPSVASMKGDWQQRSLGRPTEMLKGDRFVQNVHLLPGFPFLGQLCMDQVVWIYDDEDRVGFTVATTQDHDEIGEHTLWARYEDNHRDNGGGHALVIESVAASTFKPHVIGPFRWYAFQLQSRAHRLTRVSLKECLAAAMMEEAKRNTILMPK